MARRWIIRGVCLTLFLLCAGAWVVSYWQSCWLSYSRACDGHYFGIDAGLAEIANGSADTTGWEWYQRDPGAVLAEYPETPNHACGFAYWPNLKTRIGDDGWIVMFPLWFPTAVSGLLLCLVWRKPVAKGAFPVIPQVAARCGLGHATSCAFTTTTPSMTLANPPHSQTD